jgi:MYXO-CTERM domain-containing protein
MLFGQRFCIPDNSFGICCDSPSDCPVVTGATAACVSSSVADALVCVESGRSYCGADTLLDPTLTQRCHKGAGGVPVRWILGDCDGDGVTNGDELTDGTDECIGPQPRGIWDGSTCLPQRTGCALTSSCGATDSGPSGTCEIADDDNGHRCVPAEEVLYCADGALECAPELIEVSDSSGMGSGHVWCIPADCAGVEDVDLLDCVTKEGAPSLFSEGDCDRDGTRNGDDPSPCVADAPPPDAGPPTDDAGVPAIDAGNGSFDAGPGGGPEPSFEGGGGCACRAATGSGSGPAGAIVALLALGAVLLRRKRC